ncbi:MAG: hypothetical protein ABIR32_05935 [Ilumatobacteraceae bacterium]
MNVRIALSGLAIVSLLSVASCSSDKSPSSSAAASTETTARTNTAPAETGVVTGETVDTPSTAGGGGADGEDAAPVGGCAGVPAKADIEKIVGIALDDGESLGTDTLDCSFRGTEDSDSLVSFSQLSSQEALASFEAQGPDTGAALIDDPGIPGAKLQFGQLYFVQNDVLYTLSVLIVGTDSETTTERAIELMKDWAAI